MIELPPLRPSTYGQAATKSEPQPRTYTAKSVEARERILQARIAELEAEVHAHTEAIKVFEVANAELEADAERYRWLRDEAQYADDGLPHVIAWKRGRFAGEQEIMAEEELDAAIDAARGKG